MSVSSADILVRESEPVTATVDGEVVILSMQAQAYFGLGDTGSRIWEMLATPRLVSELCAELTEVYQVDQQTCDHDTITFLNKLLNEGLIRIVGPEGSAR
jgi:hypothetical protein